MITINLDPRCATPATLEYKGTPVETARRNRGEYVSAALTIIQAWRKAGCPRSNVSNIATYGTTWADYCRHPLIWLGLPDPATSLLNQLRHDPDAEALTSLLQAWHKTFGSTPTTVRKVIDIAEREHDGKLMQELRELPVVDRGNINPSKLGWYLKKHANRIVGGLRLLETQADGRRAWKVVAVDGVDLNPSQMPTDDDEY